MSRCLDELTLEEVQDAVKKHLETIGKPAGPCVKHRIDYASCSDGLKREAFVQKEEFIP
jgi:hypothetical protein